jgi:hypothetical protein
LRQTYWLAVLAKRKSVGSEALLAGYQNREEHPLIVAAQARSARLAISLRKPFGFDQGEIGFTAIIKT